jgi:outer membrane usher protein
MSRIMVEHRIFFASKKVKKLTNACILAGMSSSVLWPFMAHATDIAITTDDALKDNNEKNQQADIPTLNAMVPKPAVELAAAPVEASFNSSFLIGQASNLNLSRFKNGNPVLPGSYNVDVYLNGQWQGKQKLDFTSKADQLSAETCFSLKKLEELGVDIELLTPVHADECLAISAWMKDAYYHFEMSKLRFDLSIPQAYLKRTSRGFVDPKRWDRGINAGFLAYNLNAYKTYNDNMPDRENAYLSLSAGVNLLGWQFRHDANASWQDDDKAKYKATNSYAQRAIPQVRGVLTLGQAYTGGDFFDSVGFTGAQLASDDRMLPDSLNGYAPIIRGVAQTNALVEVRQNNQLIYQTTVAAGEFVIEDLYPTGYGGELEVTVNEADGSKRQFKMPYSSVAQMLRPGISRYAATTGKVRDEALSDEPYFTQATYQRGVNNFITAYAGSTVTGDYASVLLGSAFSTPIGAVALDVTQSNTRFDKIDDKSGQSIKVSYSKLMTETNTNFSLAAYRYSTSGYYSFRDALYSQDYERRGLSSDAVYRQRSEFQLTLNQGLGPKYGSLYVTGSLRDYWNRAETTKQYQVGYNNFYKNITYGLSAQRSTDMLGIADTRYYFTMSIPFSVKNNSVTVNHSVSDEGNNWGINGSAGQNNNISYSVSGTNLGHGKEKSGNANVQYRSRYATVSGSYSQGTNYLQASAGLTGSLVTHSQGISFSPERGQTMVLVHAPDATGAQVNNTPGLRIDRWGYAVIPYITPYRLNNVTIDPQGMSHDVELESSSQQVAPYSGALVKLNFNTTKGSALLIHAKQTNGKALPFGVEALNEKNQVVGIVGQGSKVYLRTQATQGQLHFVWGVQADAQCKLDYQVLGQAVKQNGYQITEAICK